MSLRACLLLILSVFAFSYQIQPLPDLSTVPQLPLHAQNNLGFPDFSGSCITLDMRTKMVQIVNDASDYQGDDIANNMRYIKQQLDIRYGSLAEEFTVNIQIKAQTGFFNVLSSDRCTVFSIKAGNNDLFPEWSYLIYKTKRSSTNFIYEDGTGKGRGITNDQLYFFVHTIKSIEPAGVCDCGSTADIWRKIYENDSKNWNLICSKSYANRLYIGVEGNQYATIAFNCVYNIYVGYTNP